MDRVEKDCRWTWVSGFTDETQKKDSNNQSNAPKEKRSHYSTFIIHLYLNTLDGHKIFKRSLLIEKQCELSLVFFYFTTEALISWIVLESARIYMEASWGPEKVQNWWFRTSYSTLCSIGRERVRWSSTKSKAQIIWKLSNHRAITVHGEILEKKARAALHNEKKWVINLYFRSSLLKSSAI